MPNASLDQAAALSQVLAARYSCRAYLPQAVPAEVLQAIVSDAGRAPSWCNAQPWQVTLTSGAETDRFRAALLAAATSEKPTPDLPWPEGYPGATGERRRECGFQLYDAVGIERSDKPARIAQSMRNYALFDAPHVAIIHAERALGPYGALDVGGFVTAFMLAATARGVGTIAQASVAAFPDMIRAHFGLDDSRVILCAISLGYADADHPANNFRTTRADLDAVLDLRE